MNWENLDDEIVQENHNLSFLQGETRPHRMTTEDTDKKALQLSKYQDPSKNINRQVLIAIANRFGGLLVQNHMQEIIDTLLTDNCESFLFNFLDGDPVSFTIGNKLFSELYKGARIIERKVRETHVDSDRNVVFQICDCEILQSEGTSVVTQATFELFTVSDGKIQRYRAGFASYVPEHGPNNLFEPTRKDLMLEKVKELNYAFADQPNLEKIASLLHEKTEYKFCDWDGQKLYTFHKQDFIEGFKSLEENYTLKCIVPYEVYSETEHIIGTYVYHLESKTEPGKEFVWLSTCLYTFDKDINIVHIIQQGELYPKDDVTIPFEVYCPQKINEKVREFLDQLKVEVDLFYDYKVDFNCTISRFGPIISPYIGTYKGMKDIASHRAKIMSALNLQWSKAVDVFVDLQNPSYDIAIAMTCSQGKINSDKYRYHGKLINFVSMTKYCFENGKLAKMCQFYIDLPEPIPSPFEDQEFGGMNIKPRKI